MRWWLLICILCAPPALAQWVQFTPCGFGDFTKHEDVLVGVPTGPAPSYGPVWLWAPAVIAVADIKEPPGAKVQCSMIAYGPSDVMVIGTGDEVLRKLGK